MGVAPSRADIQAASLDLKACLERHMPNERRKKETDPNKLLKKCQIEFDAFKSELPPGAEADVLPLLKQDLEADLKKEQ